MIYLDSSVVLARLFAEDRSPADGFWVQAFVSSRLLEFEVFNRVHARGGAASYAVDARHFVDRVSLLELSPRVLARALQAFPLPVRTLDALHLATMDFLRVHGQTIELATYDERLAAAAKALGFARAEV
ncbi:MAG: Ribonuclease VapC46 [Burkholderiaceae bacterium]|nr:Ribonuclease VapC46 [Burkholderiaceae bacterium]